jgi:hypothetical protein
MPAGRPKGSTGTYSRWSPENTARLLEDADILLSQDPDLRASEEINNTLLAKKLREQHPKRYGYISVGHLRQQLESREYRERNRKKTLDELDAFNADVLAHLLGEK